MTAVIFDSLTLVKRLRGSGISDVQSEAIVDMTRDAMLSMATKADIDSAIRSLDPKFAAIDQRFAAIDQRFAAIDQRFSAIDHRFELIEQKFTILEQRLTLKLGSIVVIALGAFTAISKLIG